MAGRKESLSKDTGEFLDEIRTNGTIDMVHGRRSHRHLLHGIGSIRTLTEQNNTGGSNMLGLVFAPGSQAGGPSEVA